MKEVKTDIQTGIVGLIATAVFGGLSVAFALLVTIGNLHAFIVTACGLAFLTGILLMLTIISFASAFERLEDAKEELTDPPA